MPKVLDDIVSLIDAKGKILNIPGFLQYCGNFWDLAHFTIWSNTLGHHFLIKNTGSAD